MQAIIESINWSIVAPFIVIQGILMIVAILDWAKADDFRGARWLWFFIIVSLNTSGPIIYFIFGRRR